AEIIRALGFEKIEIAYRPCADDLRDVARNDFTRLRFARLIADRDPPTRFNQLSDITLRRMVWNAAHWNAIALGQRDVEQSRCFPGVLEEQFVKISQSNKQKRV